MSKKSVQRVVIAVIAVVLVGTMIFGLVISLGVRAPVEQTDVPYDYGITPFSEEWYALPTETQRAIFTITDDIAKSLTTSALFETILNNPFFVDSMMYGDYATGFKETNDRLKIQYFLSRKDAKDVVESKMTYLEDTYNVNMEIIQNTDLTAISDAENFVMLEYLFCNAVLGELD